MTERKVALVTGAAGGIGAAIATRLAADGFDIGIAYHSNESGAAAVAAECRAAGARAVLIKADLADQGDVLRMFAEIDETFARLDVFVHNAAVFVWAKLGRAAEQDWRRSFAVNVDALNTGLGEVAKRMADNGRVVTISSLNVEAGLPGSGPYVASKAAAEALTRVAAKELGKRGITANTVQLGLVDTPTARAGLDAMFAPVAAQTTVQRNGTPADVAGTVAFLAGRDAGWLTGQTIDLDGGFAK